MKNIMPLVGCIVLFGLLVSCGSSSSESKARTGRLVLKVVWPERSRLIPLASNSIKATLSSGGTVLGTQVLPRPAEGNQTTVTFQNLPPGNANLAATAYPNTDATGVAQATGSVPVTIVAGQTSEVTVTMASTIDHLEISPANPSIQTQQDVQLTMTARNAANEVVLTFPSKVQWSSVSPGIATVDNTGKVSGLAAGQVQIRVTETESGKSAETTVTVTAQAVSNVFLYVRVLQTAGGANQPLLGQYRIEADGTLTPLSPFLLTTSRDPFEVGAHPNGRYVYVGNRNHGTISQYRVTSNGTLAPLSPETVALTGGSGYFLRVDPLGRAVYTTNGLGSPHVVEQFKINPDGTLTPFSPPSVATTLSPGPITVSPNGNFAYVVGQGGTIGQHRINADGSLGPVDVLTLETGANLTPLAIERQGRYAYVVGSNNRKLYQFRIGNDGKLVTLSPSTVTAPINANFVQVEPTSHFAYVGDASGNNILTRFTIGADGTLTNPVSDSLTTGSGPTSMTFDPMGQYAYVTSAYDFRISQYRVNADGTLTALSPAFVRLDYRPDFIAIAMPQQ